MKFILLAIFVLLAAQPLQGSVCDMFDDQKTDHSQHGDMLDAPMEENHGQGMDCCDHDPAGTGDGCSFMSHCGVSTTGLAAVNPITFNVIFNTSSRQYPPGTSEPINRDNSPPFRPPIA